MTQTDTRESALGAFLRDRRTKLDPASFGLPLTRRRTPGLRREEVAQRANVSATWYTWLEQGRGGAPSADVLDRIARALMLTGAEREHLFILGLGRLPEVRLQADDSVTPRLQRLVDGLSTVPQWSRTPPGTSSPGTARLQRYWTDYGALPPERRNVLRVFFGNPHVREAQFDWESVARFVVGVFRADVARVGASAKVAALVDDLSRQSPDFDRLWRSNDVLSHGGVARGRAPRRAQRQGRATAADRRRGRSRAALHRVSAAPGAHRQDRERGHLRRRGDREGVVGSLA